MKEIECKICKTKFIPKNYQTDICDKDHYKTCLYCGKEFKVINYKKSYNNYLKQNFCSRQCSMNYVNKANIKCICKNCGKEFETKNHGGNKDLCDSCRGKILEVRKCKNCNKEFEVYKNSKKQFCSRHCSAIYNNKYVRAPKASMTIKNKSISIYPENLVKFLKDDNYTKEILDSIYRKRGKVTYLYLSKELFNNFGYQRIIDRVKSLNLEDKYIMKGIFTGDTSINTDLKEELLKELPDLKIELEQKIFGDNRKRVDLLVNNKIGIEVNPVHTHNSDIDFVGFKSHSTIKNKCYHQNKSLLARQNNYYLYHYFSRDKFEDLLDYIKTNLGYNEKIYARKCKIIELSNKEVKDFINKNHRQGYIAASINLGLVYKDDLVSVMSFSKPRYNKKYEYELLRFCSLKGYSVLGGASKLFKYFIKTYNPKSVISYADIAHTTGNIYKTLGFKLLGISSPNYIWYNLKDFDVYYTRYETQRHKLSILFNEEFDKSLSESDIMLSKGFVRVYDSGNYIYVYE